MVGLVVFHQILCYFFWANGVYDKAELTIQNREFSLSFLYEIYIINDLEQVSNH